MYNLHTITQTDLKCSIPWVDNCLWPLKLSKGKIQNIATIPENFLVPPSSQGLPHTPGGNHFLIYTNIDLFCLLKCTWMKSYNMCSLVSGIFYLTMLLAFILLLNDSIVTLFFFFLISEWYSITVIFILSMNISWLPTFDNNE